MHQDYIELQLRLAAMARQHPGFPSSRTAYFQSLGFALHATQDSLAPGHSGYPKWEGTENLPVLIEHVLGDFIVGPYEFAALVGISQQVLKNFEKERGS